MVSSASELLPEPLGPQQTDMRSRGNDTVMFFKLCCCAPCTVRCSIFDFRFSTIDFRDDFFFASTMNDCGLKMRCRAWPVYEAEQAAISSGVPVQTIAPPP